MSKVRVTIAALIVAATTGLVGGVSMTSADAVGLLVPAPALLGPHLCC